MSKLDGAGDLGEHILNVAKNKEVVASSATSAATTLVGGSSKKSSESERPNGVSNS